MRRLALAGILLAISTAAHAATWVVNTATDGTDGTCDVANCTLREAIDSANADGGGTVHFAIGSGAASIVLTSVLPDLAAPIVIDGTTQPGYAGTPLVRLTGTGTAASCLVVRASDSTIRGLDIGNCMDGISVLSTTGTAISDIALERNFIGTRLGTASINRNAIRLEATGTSTLSNVSVGNGTAAGRNILATFGFVQDSLFISGNTSNVTVAGNYFGIDEAGTGLQTAARFTTDIGIYGSAGSSNITIGGPSAAERNVLASGGGVQVHVKIDSSGSNLNIEGNYIGTDPTGMTRMGASNFGIWFFAQGTATIRNNLIATTGGNAVSRGVTTTGAVIVQGNRINMKADGSAAFAPVPSTAINDFSSAPGYVIGGPNPGDGNVIANYSTAVFVNSPQALVQGNLLGLDPTGTNVLGGGLRGIAVSFARIEPGVFFRDNKIAGFGTGIEVGTEALATVENNFIGTDATGTLARPNTNGIVVKGAAGRTMIANNVIAGNTANGILVDATTMPVSIVGNRIGLDSGNAPLPNGGDGIRHVNGTAAKNVGFLAGNANTIAYNGGSGVSVVGGGAMSIQGNSIFDNTGLAIDLGTAGVTVNDAGDADTGGNGLQNAPVLTGASNGGSSTSIEGALDSTPGSAFTIELFTNPIADATNHGEAKTFLTRFNVATDAGGGAVFSAVVPLLAPGTIVSASATNVATQETSEMSNDVTVVDGGVLQFSASAQSVAESAGSITITVTRTGGSGPATVQYTSTDGTATAAGDYTAVAGTLSFGAADASQTFLVPIAPDGLDETDETFTLTLSGVTGGVLGTPVVTTVTITDDDPEPGLGVSDPSLAEGNAGTGILSFDVQLTAASAKTVTVDYSTVDQTANAGPDYGQRVGTLTFVPGETSKSVSVIVHGDTTAEADETLRLVLTAPSNATLADAEGIGTILNDDGLPAVSVADGTVIEGDAGTSTATVMLALSNPSSVAVSVDWSTSAGTAAAGSDFTTSGGTLTFDPGVTELTVGVPVIGDIAVEAAEQFEINLVNPSGGTLGDAQGLVTIADDDGDPSLTIGSVAVGESAGTATLTVLLAPASAQTVTVSYALSDGTATAGSDYTGGGAQLSFDPGTTTQTFTVPVANDNFTEGTETFDVALSGPSNAAIADGSASVTIIDDDATPTASIDDVNAVEGSGSAPFTVSLSNPSASTVTMNWATSAGSATSGVDFTAAGGPLTFAPGETTKPVPVAISADALDEPDETFFVTLSGVTNAILTRSRGTGTIVNDDGTPALLIGDATVTEGDAGSSMASFAVTLAGSTAQTVTVQYAVAAGTAAANGDYAPVAGTLTFAPGVTLQSVDVPVVGDSIVETNETFFVNLSSPEHASISDGQALGTIVNDDSAAVVPSIDIADTAVAEGNAGTVAATFTVTLSQATTTTVTVDYATANGSANAGSDYGATAGTLVFPPGVLTRSAVVAVAGDTLIEGNETFAVLLTNAANATLADVQATGTILDDDASGPVPALTIGNASVSEGDAGTTTATFVVTLQGAPASSVTVGYSTADGTATAGSDYGAASGTLVFLPGVATQSINVAIAGDTTVEPNETFTVTLANPMNAVIADPQGVGTITNDDRPEPALPSLTVADVRIVEGNEGTSQAVLTLELSAVPPAGASVRWITREGTAAAGVDFTEGSGRVVFERVRTATISVPIIGDTIDEDDETFGVELFDPSRLALQTSAAIVTIADDDAPAPLRAIVLVVGSLRGEAGSHFRTAVQMLNPFDVPMNGTMVVHPAGASTADGDAEIAYSLAPGEARSSADLLGEHGLSGLATLDLRPVTGGIPRMSVRIYDDGGARGTTGFTLPVLTPEDALPAGAVASLFAPPDPIAMRFNVGVRTLDDGASLVVEVHDRNGALLRTTPRDYPANWFNQVAGAAFADMGLSAGDYLVIRVIRGSAILYGATVDNVTNDPSVEVVTR